MEQITFTATDASETITVILNENARGPSGDGLEIVSETAPPITKNGLRWFCPIDCVRSTSYDGYWVADSGPAGTGTGTATVTPTDLGVTTELVPGSRYYHATLTSRTFSFSEALENGDAIQIDFIAAAQTILQFPAARRTGDEVGTVTSITFPAGNHVIKWEQLGTILKVADSAWVDSATETTAPTLISATVASNGTTITLIFSETVAVNVGNSITVDGSTNGTATASYTGGAGTTHTWSLSETMLAGENLTLDYTTSANDIEDSVGNDLASIAGFTVINNSAQGTDVTAPTVLSATLAADGVTLTVVFSESVTVVVGPFVVNGSISYGPADAFYTSGSGATHIWTLEAALENGETLTLAYTGAAANDIQDAAGNDLADFASFAVVNNSTQGADTTAPTLSAVSGTQTGQTTATISATTNENNGVMYWFVGTEFASPPAQSDMEDGTGSPDFWTSSAVTSSGAKTVSATGLNTATIYQLWVMHKDAAGNYSDIENYQYFTTAAAPSGYALEEGFETATTGYEEAATLGFASGATINPVSTSSPIVGTQSLRYQATANHRVVYWNFTETSGTETFAFLRWRVASIPVSGTTFLTIRDSGGSELAMVELRSDARFGIRSSGGFFNYSSTLVTAGQDLYLWIYHKQGNGTNAEARLGWSTTSTMPTEPFAASGAYTCANITGTSLNKAARIQLGHTSSHTIDWTADRILIKHSSIGNNP